MKRKMEAKKATSKTKKIKINNEAIENQTAILDKNEGNQANASNAILQPAHENAGERVRNQPIRRRLTRAPFFMYDFVNERTRNEPRPTRQRSVRNYNIVNGQNGLRINEIPPAANYRRQNLLLDFLQPTRYRGNRGAVRNDWLRDYNIENESAGYRMDISFIFPNRDEVVYEFYYETDDEVTESEREAFGYEGIFSSLYRTFDSLVSMLNVIYKKDKTVKKEDMEKIKIVKYKNKGLKEECSICMENFVDEEEVRILKCDHFFHCKCVDKWFIDYSNKCPMCRKMVVDEEKAPNIVNEI